MINNNITLNDKEWHNSHDKEWHNSHHKQDQSKKNRNHSHKSSSKWREFMQTNNKNA